MMCYSVQTRDWMFAKGYGVLSFAKSMSKDIVKIVGKCRQKLLDHAKQFATDTIKTSTIKTISKRAICKIAEATRVKIADRITKVAKNFTTK